MQAPNQIKITIKIKRKNKNPLHFPHFSLSREKCRRKGGFRRYYGDCSATARGRSLPQSYRSFLFLRRPRACAGARAQVHNASAVVAPKRCRFWWETRILRSTWSCWTSASLLSLKTLLLSLVSNLTLAGPNLRYIYSHIHTHTHTDVCVCLKLKDESFWSLKFKNWAYLVPE